MVKVYNRRIGGDLYHYAHFLCDCVLPEFLANIHERNEKVYRIKNLDQTLGNFSKMWEEIFDMSNIEVSEFEYNKIPDETLTIYRERMNSGQGPNVDEINLFRHYIFQRFNIDYDNYDHTHYPKILLIERDERVELLNDKELLQNQNIDLTTGKERREIENIEILKSHLEKTYQNNYKCVRFAGMKFREQINYFNNACMIICAHGAAMSNMIFCKPNTIIIEVTCKVDWSFFNKISNHINLNHRKCDNNVERIINIVKNNVRHMNVKL